jgi:predicted aldo/keto reductase-like oxidoreductase
VIGMKNPMHIEENVKIGNIDWKLTEKERKEIVKKFENFLGKNFCRMCRYCEGCPMYIPIPDIMKLRIIAKRYGYVNFVKWQYLLHVKNRNICNECGECEKKCPYNIPVINILKKLDEMMRS